MVSIVKNYTGTRGTSQASMVPPHGAGSVWGHTKAWAYDRRGERIVSSRKGGTEIAHIGTTIFRAFRSPRLHTVPTLLVVHSHPQAEHGGASVEKQAWMKYLLCGLLFLLSFLLQRAPTLPGDAVFPITDGKLRLLIRRVSLPEIQNKKMHQTTGFSASEQPFPKT